MDITGCCSKSENENITSSPASFLLIHNFCTGLIEIRGWGRSKPTKGVAIPGPRGPSTLKLTAPLQPSTHDRRKSARRNARTENAARRSADNIRADGPPPPKPGSSSTATRMKRCPGRKENSYQAATSCRLAPVAAGASFFFGRIIQRLDACPKMSYLRDSL